MATATRSKGDASRDAASTSKESAGAPRITPRAPLFTGPGPRRRWISIGAIALALLVALVAQWISARTALMLGGSLLAFALSAERLDSHGD